MLRGHRSSLRRMGYPAGAGARYRHAEAQKRKPLRGCLHRDWVITRSATVRSRPAGLLRGVPQVRAERNRQEGQGPTNPEIVMPDVNRHPPAKRPNT